MPAAPELPTQLDVEDWFSRHGVPLFSERYRLEDVELVGAALLTVVAAFELTVLPWLDHGVAGSLLILFALTAVMLPLVPVFRALWGPWRHDDRRPLIGRTLVRGAPLAALALVVFAETTRGIRWPGWIDFLVLVTLLLTAAVVGRCKRNGTWAEAPVRQRSILFAGVVASMFFFAVNLNYTPPLTTELLNGPAGSVSGALEPPPASLAAFPLAAVFLVRAMRLPSGGRGADLIHAGGHSTVDFIPTLLVVLGIQATILPYVHASRLITYLMPLALVAILYLAPGLVRELGQRLVAGPGARRVFARALRAGALATFIFGMPVLVGITDAGLDFRDALIVNVIFLAGAAIFVGFALDRVSEAMVREAFRNLPSTFAALAQGLPLLLIVLVFLGITTEVWQVSAALDRRHFFFLAGALAVVTVGFAALRSLQDVHHIRRFKDGWREIADAAPVEEQPARELVTAVAARMLKSSPDAPVEVHLRPLQFLNASFLMSIYQLIFATLVTVLMTVVFYAIGKWTIDRDLLSEWSVKAHSGGRFADLALVDQPWARVAMLLGLFSAFYFLVTFTTDDDLRDKVLKTPDTALKRRFAVRAAYLEQFNCLHEERGSRARGAARVLLGKVRSDSQIGTPL
jgi:hypothetical protein